jgi:guanylate kinase
VNARGFALVLAAPSGAGKTTLAHSLVARHADVVFSVSATTRAPRGIERHGHDYYFVDDAEFDRMLDAGELVEWAAVHDRRYGTPRGSVEAAIARGCTVVLDIDFQGARQIRTAFPDAVLVYILPPSVQELGRRLTDRRSEHDVERKRRLITARIELTAVNEFDYVLVNDELDRTLASLESILHAERCRVARVAGLAERLTQLGNDLDELIVKE